MNKEQQHNGMSRRSSLKVFGGLGLGLAGLVVIPGSSVGVKTPESENSAGLGEFPDKGRVVFDIESERLIVLDAESVPISVYSDKQTAFKPRKFDNGITVQLYGHKEEGRTIIWPPRGYLVIDGEGEIIRGQVEFGNFPLATGAEAGGGR